MYQPAILQSRVLVIVSLLILIQDVKGVEESGDDQDHDSAGSGNGQNVLTIDLRSDCGLFTNFSNCALDHLLCNLTSNNLINVTADVMLLSTVTLVALDNISIIGHNNPTVNCDNAGGIHFYNCHNCSIIGITWEKCGDKTDSKPALELYNSSNITIQNCSFKLSQTQVIALSEMSGNVSINSCKFVFNNYFKGNGAAIHYLPKIKHRLPFQLLMIIDCNFTQNEASDDASIIYIGPSSSKSVEQIYFTNTLFLSNRGTPIYISYQMVIISGFMIFEENKGRSGGGMSITNHSSIVFQKSKIKCINNAAVNHGGSFNIQNSNIVVNANSTITFDGNKAGSGGAFWMSQNSIVTFEENSAVTFSNNQANNGGALLIWNSNVIFKETSAVTFSNNQAAHGGALLIWNSNVIFKETSAVTFSNNQAKYEGGALYIRYYSDVTFEGNSTVIITNNQADNGGVLYIWNNSNFTFEGNSTVTISNNQADRNGGALYIWYNSNVTFEGNSTVTFSNNQANIGGALLIRNSNVIFKENSAVRFSDNQADDDGGALYIGYYSDVTFEGNSTVIITNNQAAYGGALFIWISDVTFEGNSAVTISDNEADYGGALSIWGNSDVTFEGNSTVTISGNQADRNGGALYIWDSTDVTIKGNSLVKFDNNIAYNSGGALYLIQDSNVLFEEDSCVIFYNNTASVFGGALCALNNCKVTIKGNSNAKFNNNQALGGGGALYAIGNSVILFQARSTVQFNDNKALGDGGALHTGYDYDITFENDCTITFSLNEASQGGAIFTPSTIVFTENSSVQFDNNKATLGGALHVSRTTFKENTAVIFENNEAITNGGAIYSGNSSITIKQNSTIIFISNEAENGGAVFASSSSLLVSEYSNLIFCKNVARQNGGAIYFNDQIYASFSNSSAVTMTSNFANNHGGAIYNKITQNTNYFNISEIKVSSDNTAGVAGSLLYIDVPKSCSNSCLTDRIVGVSNDTLYQGTLDKNIATSPKLLKFNETAKCISSKSAQCEKYYIDNIMLGQEILIYPCLLDHYNNPAEVTQFRIIGEKNQNYYSVHGLEYASISCNNAIEGISIVGNKTISDIPLNYSMNFTSYATVRKVISTNLIIELSPCHLGFQYQSKSQRCECYSKGEAVSCSGSSSAIKRGYWFGYVTGIPTVTFCPINYCNFTCCKATNGYYHLSPVRTNQCRQHRDGTACGNCVKGYTLPYYSSECVNTDNCTTAWTVAVVILTVLYWIAMVIAVFVMMHYRISIGYLYAITYYYSIVDILLNENVDYLPDGLYIFINIIYSVVELTPQFLGKLCLLRNISGIDQQFIHYIHPLAVSLILVIITLVARCSRRLSLLISRGIIHVICLLLLLSYTSVTTTSLLLLKYSRFDGVNKVYSFISPDNAYFHGRHLAYGIIALLCTIVVVVGLPLLLLLEPLLNRKINFIKIKPLLDQFQGCYKDKFRWFAAYYMICRLVIITITIIFTSNDFTGQYLLITVCAAMVLIHLVVKPYNATVLNILDGILLLFLVLTTVLLLTEFDESSTAIPVTLLLLILPLIIVGAVYLLACKGNIKGIFAKLFNRVDDHKFDSTEMAARNFDVIVDESMRQNATICTM